MKHLYCAYDYCGRRHPYAPGIAADVYRAGPGWRVLVLSPDWGHYNEAIARVRGLRLNLPLGLTDDEVCDILDAGPGSDAVVRWLISLDPSTGLNPHSIYT